MRCISSLCYRERRTTSAIRSPLRCRRPRRTDAPRHCDRLHASLPGSIVPSSRGTEAPPSRRCRFNIWDYTCMAESEASFVTRMTLVTDAGLTTASVVAGQCPLSGCQSGHYAGAVVSLKMTQSVIAGAVLMSQKGGSRLRGSIATSVCVNLRLTRRCEMAFRPPDRCYTYYNCRTPLRKLEK
jgi:hypothetical protein